MTVTPHKFIGGSRSRHELDGERMVLPVGAVGCDGKPSIVQWVSLTDGVPTSVSIPVGGGVALAGIDPWNELLDDGGKAMAMVAGATKSCAVDSTRLADRNATEDEQKERDREQAILAGHTWAATELDYDRATVVCDANARSLVRVDRQTGQRQTHHLSDEELVSKMSWISQTFKEDGSIAGPNWTGGYWRLRDSRTLLIRSPLTHWSMVAADVPQVGMSSFILDVSTADFSHLGISGTREGALHRIVFTSH